jgi:hypothetical protein
VSRVLGSLVVQNEADVIEELLGWLSSVDLFDKILFFDLGSTDDTFEKALRFGDLLHDPRRLALPYSEELRVRLLLEHAATEASPGDWLAILDADEFYAEDPRPVIAAAEAADADSVFTFQIEYFLTDSDVAALPNEDFTIPVRERRRHYLIDWTEPRFFRWFHPQQEVFSARNPSPRRLLNRHYQYRTPKQIQRRIETRSAARRATLDNPLGFRWPQIFSPHWHDYVVPEELLHPDDGREWRFGLPSAVRVEGYQNLFPHHPLGRTAIEMTNIAHAAGSAAPATIIRAGVVAGEVTGDPYGCRSLWVACEGATERTYVLCDGTPLETVVAGVELVTAKLPVTLCRLNHGHTITLSHFGVRSAPLWIECE